MGDQLPSAYVSSTLQLALSADQRLSIHYVHGWRLEPEVVSVVVNHGGGVLPEGGGEEGSTDAGEKQSGCSHGMAKMES